MKGIYAETNDYAILDFLILKDIEFQQVLGEMARNRPGKPVCGRCRRASSLGAGSAFISPWTSVLLQPSLKAL